MKSCGFSILVLGLVFSSMANAGDSAQDNPNWPKTLDINGKEITLYQPQVNSYDNGKMSFLATVGATINKQTIYGTMDAKCDATVNKETQAIDCEHISINKLNFPAVGNQQDITSLINDNFTDKAIQFNKSELDSSMKMPKINQLQADNSDFKGVPPKISVVNNPTALVIIDGEPQLRKIPQTDLMRVINSPFSIVLDTKPGNYYLQAGKYWMTTHDLNGKWVVADPVPDAIKKLEADPDHYGKGTQATFTAPPDVIVSTKPAELIQIKGEPQFTPLQGADLMYVNNTETNLLYQVKEQAYYALLSGRWYTSNSLSSDADWKYVPANSLPDSFKNIPDDSPKANVLASIPDTPQAQEAVLSNDVPHTARVDRSTATVKVTYEGAPQFKKIPGTDMQYGVNTSFSVILLNNKYYVSYQGVWFIGDTPTGPWTVLTDVPDDIYKIPPQSPVYNVTKNYVYGSSPSYVSVGYTGGYLNNFNNNGVIVFGTGNPYPPFINDVYFGYPLTYGFNFVYGPFGGFIPAIPYIDPFFFGAGLVFGPDPFGPLGPFGPNGLYGGFGPFAGFGPDGYPFGPIDFGPFGPFGPLGFNNGLFGPGDGGIFFDALLLNNIDFPDNPFFQNNLYDRWDPKMVDKIHNPGVPLMKKEKTTEKKTKSTDCSQQPTKKNTLKITDSKVVPPPVVTPQQQEEPVIKHTAKKKTTVTKTVTKTHTKPKKKTIYINVYQPQPIHIQPGYGGGYYGGHGGGGYYGGHGGGGYYGGHGGGGYYGGHGGGGYYGGHGGGGCH